MDNVSETHKSIPTLGSRGLSDAIRRMAFDDKLVIPAAMQGSVHACARSAGAKMKTRSNDDGTVTIWKIASATTGPIPTKSVGESGRRPFSYVELRSFFDKYVASHSVEQAIDILKSFGCSRITEAASLPYARMNELVDTLDGPDWFIGNTQPSAPTTKPAVPFKSAFEVTAPGPGNLPSGYYTMEAAGSTIWHEGPPPDAPPGYVPPAPAKPKPKYQPPDLGPSIMPPGLSFTPDDVPYLGHRHSTFRSIEGTRYILNFHGCDSTAEGQALPQPQLNALCFAFVLALGQDNHSSLLESQPQLQLLFSKMGWKPEVVTIFSGPPASATKSFSMEELRTIFYKYVDANSMEKAREVLDPFNCSHSISQAWYNLDAAGMRDLVARLSTPSPASNLSIFD